MKTDLLLRGANTTIMIVKYKKSYDDPWKEQNLYSFLLCRVKELSSKSAHKHFIEEALLTLICANIDGKKLTMSDLHSMIDLSNYSEVTIPMN